MSDSLDLKIGKPIVGAEEKIATYTRFVLPFAFQLQTATEVTDAPDLFYTLNDKTDLSFIKRRKYFTRETANTLYERGQWLSVCDNWMQTKWGKAEVTVNLRNDAFKIGMLPPQIVLFETPEIKPQKECNILQTGFLYVDVYFAEKQETRPQLDDLLVLNEFFRYFGMPYDSHASIFQNIFSEVPINIEETATIGSSDDNLKRYFERWAFLLEIPIKIDNHYLHLFPKDWAIAARKWMYNTSSDNQAEHWQIYADNRCYVWTVAFLDEGGKTLQSSFEPSKTTLEASDYGHWIKLLNVDNPPFDDDSKQYKTPQHTHSSVSQFERQWAEPRTYKRWQHDGTWYGFCYHSAATLALPKPFIFSPSATYYFDTTVLLLYIRMVLFRFGRELSKAVPDTEKQNEQHAREKLQDLRRLFSSFTVLYRFPLLSNQQQHIEMYEINRKFLDIDQFFAEIQQEIDNTHEFLETVESNRLASAANRLATWGIPLAAGGLMTALFSMGDLNLWQCFVQNKVCAADFEWLFQAGMVGIVVLLMTVLPGFWSWLKK